MKAVKTILAILGVAACALSAGIAAGPSGIAGQWRAEFSTQIGQQKYLFTFQQNAGKVSGKAVAEVDGRKRDVELKDTKLEGDTLTFFETFKFQDNEVRIDYSGKLSGNQINFTRKVGDFATEEFAAKRVEPALGATAEPTSSAVTNRPARRDGRFGGPIVLGPDDKPAFPAPPAGFDSRREGIPHGKLEMVEYDSKTVGTKRRMQVYTPPGYTSDKKYPVLYLLHGIGGDETEWERFAHPDFMLDNLLAEQKSVPMLVVMPNGRAQKNDRAEGDVYRTAPAFANFEHDLLDDVIPTIQARYSVIADREHRALAGLSMGGGQSLNFGLAHLDTFAWVGGFSSAPNTKSPQELVPDPALAAQQLKLLWLACGNKDGLIRISQGVHNYLKEKGVPHVWTVDGNAHDPTEWRNNLYYFVQRLFL